MPSSVKKIKNKASFLNTSVQTGYQWITATWNAPTGFVLQTVPLSAHVQYL